MQNFEIFNMQNSEISFPKILNETHHCVPVLLTKEERNLQLEDYETKKKKKKSLVKTLRPIKWNRWAKQKKQLGRDCMVVLERCHIISFEEIKQ